MNAFDFGKLLGDISNWFSQNIFSGPFGEALMTFLRSGGNLLIKILEFFVSIFQFLINWLGSIIMR